MAVIAACLAELAGKGLGRQVVERAKGLLAKLILPREVTKQVVERYIRKAMQIHIWHRLGREERALLIVVRRFNLVRSPVLRSVLHRIFLEIEMFTVRGKALFYGIIISMQSYMHRVSEEHKNVSHLLATGISYLNNPPMYRIYG